VAIDKFYKDSFTLTLSNMVTGIISFIFSVVLSRKLGAEGLGLYGLIMPIYGLLLCITSDGLITSVSKKTALYFNRRDIKNLNRTLHTVLVFVFFTAFNVALLAFLLRKGIAYYLVRDARSVTAIKCLCPAVLFVPLSAVIKGYFYGLGKYMVTSSIDIVEKLLRVVILLSAVSILKPVTVDKTVAIAYLALAVGELVSMLMLYTSYRIQRSKLKPVTGKSISRIQLLFDVLVISLPLGLNGILSSILSALSALMLPRRLIASGLSYGEALAAIGKFSGMALNISSLPSIIIGSMLTVLVPELSLNISRKDFWSAEERIAQVLKLSFAVGIATASICLSLPETLGYLFYQRNDLGNMIRFSSVICLFSFVSSPSFGILNALGKQNILLKNSTLISLESLFLTFIFASIPKLNIYGYGLSIIITAITALVINIREIRKVCVFNIDIQDIITLLLTGAAAYLIAITLNSILIGAAPVIRALAVIFACFGTVFGLGGISFSVR